MEYNIIKPEVIHKNVRDITVDDACELIEAIGLDNKNTEIDYKGKIALYVHFINENGMQYNTLVKYREMLAKRTDWSVSTKNKYFVAAKKLTKVLHNIGATKFDATLRIDGSSVRGFTSSIAHKKNGVSREDAERLAEYLRNLPDTVENSRLKAMMGMFIYQGLRQIEVARLDVTDINFKDKTARILGKGRDDHEIIPLLDETVVLLKHYTEKANLKSGPLFPSLSNQTKGERVSTRGIRDIVKSTFQNVGIGERSTHDMRHYFVTALYRKYRDPLKVQKYSRHKSMAMVGVYCDEVDLQDDKKNFQAAFQNIKF